MRAIQYTMAIIILAAASLLSSTAMAQNYGSRSFQSTVSIQAVLRDTLGVPIPDGVHSVTFRFYDDSSGGALLFSQNKNVVTEKGAFTTALFVDTSIVKPAIGPIPLDGIRQEYFSMQVAGDTESTRMAILPVPYSMGARSVVGDFWSTFGRVAFTADTVDFLPAIYLLARDTASDGSFYPASIVLRDTLGDNTVSIESDGDARFAGDVGIGTSTPNSALHVTGPIATALSQSSTPITYSLGASHSVHVATVNLPFAQTVRLPSAVGINGRQYTIKRTGTGSVTVSTTGGETIDGSPTYTLSALWKYVVVVSNGSNWLIVGNN